MKKIALAYCLFLASFLNAQIKGQITSTKKEALSFVSVYLDGTVTGTTSNDEGYYELPLKKVGKYTVVFQFLGFKTLKKKIEIRDFPFKLNVQLKEETVTLDEVTIDSKENIAHKIIRNVIANKDKNEAKVLQYTADFYSRGLYKIKNAPKQILGQKLGDFGGGLDSTRSGIIYLSETFSKISHQKPNKFKEHIVASKVSGSDNGVSFNRAEDANFNFYKNTIEIGNEIISPIANYAFGYYSYKLVGSFYEKNGQQINKIQVIPKRKNDRVFSGFLYIVEDDWALYGADISVTGAQVNLPMVDRLRFKQSFNKANETRAWVLISQTIDFKIGMFGIKINGRFSSAFTNYNFNPNFTKNTFGKEILSFENNATKKDTTYWNKLRPIPLTTEEVKDYVVKDSIKIVRKSKKYLDSIDAKNNKLSWTFPLSGYTYRNSYKKWSLNFDSPIEHLSFNTVQGWNSSLGFSYFKTLNETGKWMNFSTNFNYGFSDKQLRPTFSFAYKWDNITRPILRISGGKTTRQFNNQNPISKLYNTISSIFYEQNYLKIYEKTFVNVGFSKELANGFWFNSSLEYADRRPLINTTNYSARNIENREYTANDPQDPANFSPSFNQHQIWTLNVGTTIHFGTKYLSYPDRKFTVYNNNYPSLYVGYRKTFGSNNSQNHSDLFYTRIGQRFSLGNLGNSKYRIKAGYFLNKKDIPFMDYAHFNGNKFAFPSPNGTMNSFNLLDYYSHSTNDKYAEFHGEHNFKGFLLSKIPLINKLNFHVVAGAKGLFTGDRKPYTEASIGIDNIGWSKWRFLRIDYVISKGGIYQKQNGFVFTLGLFN
ncbi:MAG: carboxypeptidase-like regulatory domain-containing protein [Flavobacteriaceae bacterium]|nr:carboxypeptidase-like regulatory domain-containing protein [Flavobacteriaceae bacterium]